LGESRGLGDLEPRGALARGQGFPQFPQALSIFFVVGDRIACSQILSRRQVRGDPDGMIDYYSDTIEKVKYNFCEPARRTEFLRTISRKNSSRVLREYWHSIDARM
jgi:hypothetical protein